MQVKLHLVKGNPQGKLVEVPSGTLTVGRAEDSGLIIASTRVSRHHCEIVNENNRVILRDKGSGNGTLVNGVKVTEQDLGAGDEVVIGPLTFQVEINGKRQGAPVQAKPAQAKPVQAKPVPARPTLAKPVAAPQPAKKSFAKASPADILSSLENLAGKKPGQKSGKDDVLQISDDDLLDPNQ
jgi:pSer/pThr/pTyr-binding forkhead associated (FHA) protein